MKKLMLCSAIMSAMVLSGCNFNDDGSTNLLSPKPMVTNGSTSNNANVNGSTQPTNNARTPTHNILVESESKEVIAQYYSHQNNTIKSLNMTVGNQSYKDGKIDLGAQFGQGYHETTYSQSLVVTDKTTQKDRSSTENGKMYLFQQDYSLAGAVNLTGGSVDGKVETYADAEIDDDFIIGQATRVLPKGKANYVGDAIIHTDKKDVYKTQLTYNVDFDAAKGSGKIANVAGKEITLAETEIEDIQYNSEYAGKSSFKGFFGEFKAFRDGAKGDYVLGLFGPNAEEVTGSLMIYDEKQDVYYDGIMGGKKQ